MKRLHGWRTCQLGEVVQTYSGGTPNRSRPEFFGGTIPWIKSGELNQKWITSAEECITEEGLANSAAKVVPAGSTLIALYGATAGVVGRTRISAAINQAVLAVIPDPEEIDDDFLQYALNHIGSALLRLVQGAQPNLNAGLVKESEIDLPPLPEQRKIASILGTWDRALEKLDVLISAKSQRHRELSTQLLSGKRLNKERRTKWREHALGDLLQAENRYHKWDDSAVYKLAGVRRNGGGLFFRDSLLGRQIKVKTNKKLRSGDFLISRRQISYGGMAIVPREFEGFDVNDEYEVLVIKPAANLDIGYLGHLAKTRRFRHIAYLASNGFFAERLRLNFDLGAFLQSRIRLPESIEEQREIVGFLDTADAELCLLRDQREALERQKLGLMQKLLTGKVRVSTP